MAHYYNPESLECFDCDIRKARKAGLYPSVTTKLGILRKDGLETWKIQQAILSALTRPRRPEENEDDYIKRIKQDSEQQAKDAANRGTIFHEFVEKYYKKEEYLFSPDESTRVMQKRFLEHEHEFEITPEFVEKVFINHELKLACRIDLIGEHKGKKVLVDFKTQNVKAGAKARAYDEHLYQLCGNFLCMSESGMDEFWNVIVSSNKETLGDICVHKWNYQEVVDGLIIFRQINNLFNDMKRIRP